MLKIGRLYTCMAQTLTDELNELLSKLDDLESHTNSDSVQAVRRLAEILKTLLVDLNNYQTDIAHQLQVLKARIKNIESE